MKKLTLLICAACLFLPGCPADPDEAGISNGRDFKDFDVELAGGTVITDIYFYGHLTLPEFFYYYETAVDKNNQAGFLIKCRPAEFAIYKESGSGAFTDLRYSGAPTVSSDRYHLEFPLSALELNSRHEFNIFYWFFAESSGDRMPDSGSESLTLVL